MAEGTILKLLAVRMEIENPPDAELIREHPKTTAPKAVRIGTWTSHR
jgi:hypothetical protein